MRHAHVPKKGGNQDHRHSINPAATSSRLITSSGFRAAGDGKWGYWGGIEFRCNTFSLRRLV